MPAVVGLGRTRGVGGGGGVEALLERTERDGGRKRDISGIPRGENKKAHVEDTLTLSGGWLFINIM
jgi:hypothetical protein